MENLNQPLGVCIIVTNAQHQVLLGKRKNSYLAGYYGCPGGRLEYGEPLFVCAHRELAEETGLHSAQPQYLGLVRETQSDRDFIHFIFLIDHFTGQPQILEPDKCLAWQWYSPDKLPSPLVPGHRLGIDLFFKPKLTPLIDHTLTPTI